MATTNQIQEPVIAIASENVERTAKLAWDQVYAVADSVPEPTIGKASGFLPSDLCYKVMNGAVEEYPDKAKYSASSRRISRSRKGGVVYFPGQPRIADTFTIMIPMSIRGNVQIHGMAVDTKHYYHILQECSLDIPEGGRLVALIIDNIVL